MNQRGIASHNRHIRALRKNLDILHMKAFRLTQASFVPYSGCVPASTTPSYTELYKKRVSRGSTQKTNRISDLGQVSENPPPCPMCCQPTPKPAITSRLLPLPSRTQLWGPGRERELAGGDASQPQEFGEQYPE